MNNFENMWICPDYANKLTFGIKCPHCKAVVNNYMKYCYNCGKQMIIEIKTTDEVEDETGD